MSTPHMISLMETAAFEAMQPYLDPGEISVGTAINVVHRAAATVGMRIIAEAELESFDGRFYVFHVTAEARNGNGAYEIGKGTVSRAVIKHDQLMLRVSER